MISAENDLIVVRRAPEPIPEQEILRSTWSLALESAASTYFLYKTTAHVLLLREGAEPWVTGLPIILLLVFLMLLAGRWAPRSAHSGSRETWIDHAVVSCLLVGLVLGLSLRAPVKGESGLWIPLEWQKIGQNLILMAKTSPFGALALGTGWLVVVRWLALGRRGAATLALTFGAIISALIAVLMPAERKLLIYVVAFAVPALTGAAFAYARWDRWASRFALIWASGNLIFLHYAAVLPMGQGSAFSSMPGVRLVYPMAPARADFPLKFMREFLVDESEHVLYTSFGPASGLARIDLESHTAVITPIAGLARYLWREEDSGRLFTLDWDTGDLLVLDPATLDIIKKVNLVGRDRITPSSLALTPHQIFISFQEKPILAEYRRDTLEFVRQVSFKDVGLTKFNSGLYKIAYDPPTRRLYLQLGMTDSSGLFHLVQFDPDRFEVEQSVAFRGGGLEFIGIDGTHRILLADFFSDRLTEFNLAPLEVRRVLHGPLNSRNLVFDPRRQLIYALAFLPGELHILEYGSGKTIGRFKVGKKAQSIYLAPKEDRLYLGSDRGIFVVDLPAFLRALHP